MMKNNRYGYLVENVDELRVNSGLFESGKFVIPGSYHVSKVAKEKGFNCFDGDECSAGIVGDVLEFVEVLKKFSGQFEIVEKDAILASLLSEIFKSLWLAKVQYLFEGQIKSIKPLDLKPTYDRNWSLFNSRLSIEKGYLDFTTNGKVSIKNSKSPIHLFYKRNDFLGASSAIRNLILRLSNRRKSDFYLPLYVRNFVTSSFCNYWEAFFIYRASLIDAYYQSTENVLTNSKTEISSAHFNYGSVEHVGIAKALNLHSIPVEMQSHGCLIPYQDSVAPALRKLLSENIYNFFPGVNKVYSRSPLQITLHSSDYAKEKRLIQLNAVKHHSGPIRVGYAPNFLSIKENYHGLAPSCYDVRKGAESLIKELSRDKAIELRIRIKTHNQNGVPLFNVNSPQLDRGLVPSDLMDLYKDRDKVFDDSGLAYNAYIDSLDILITSGVTAVVFDALERRVPVLLYNYDPKTDYPFDAPDISEIVWSENFIVKPVYKIKNLSDLNVGVHKIISQRQMNVQGFMDDESLSGLIWT